MFEFYYPPPWNINENQQKTEGWIEFQKAQAKEPEYYLSHLKLGWQLLTKDCWPPKDAHIVIATMSKHGYAYADVTTWNYIGNEDYYENAYWILAPEQYA